MNDFSDLEAELKRMQPAPVSPELTTRVERALNEARETATATAGVLPKAKVRTNWFALGFGVAAAAVFLLLARVNVEQPATKQSTIAANRISPAPTARAADAFVPDGLTRVVYQTRDEGLVYPRTAEQPVRRVRSRSRETLHWKNPSSGASLRVSYPTEEIQLIPVGSQ